MVTTIAVTLLHAREGPCSMQIFIRVCEHCPAILNHATRISILSAAYNHRYLETMTDWDRQGSGTTCSSLFGLLVGVSCGHAVAHSVVFRSIQACYSNRQWSHLGIPLQWCWSSFLWISGLPEFLLLKGRLVTVSLFSFLRGVWLR